jgi:hypothetical protein
VNDGALRDGRILLYDTENIKSSSETSIAKSWIFKEKKILMTDKNSLSQSR